MVFKQLANGRVDVELHSMTTTPDVFWTPRWKRAHGGFGGCNSYVLVASEHGEFTKDGQSVSLVSINGFDEYGEEVKAAKHFGLV